MDGANFEVEMCNLEVMPTSVVLTVQTADGSILTLAMPRAMAETLAFALEAGFDQVPPSMPTQ
jgi:hypothetical protein